MSCRIETSLAMSATITRRELKPVPTGISLPMITFSFKPRSSSRWPRIAASVSTRVVSWKEAIARKLSVLSAALVRPSTTGSALAGLPPCSTT